MTKLVLIIGAGPVGMTMASELARYGVTLRVIDKASQRTDKSKALVRGAGRSSCWTGAAGLARSLTPGSRPRRSISLPATR